MKQIRWKKAAAALLAAAVSILGMPGNAAWGQGLPAPQFTDLVEEGASEYGLSAVRYVEAQGSEQTPDLLPDYRVRALNLPAKYDLRTVGKGLPAIRDQKKTGSCWAHAVIGSIESQLILNGADPAATDLSEAHLVWFGCCSGITDTADPLYGDGDSLGMEGYTYGSNAQKATGVLASWSGYQLEENEPNVANMPRLDESHRYVSYGHLQNTACYDTTDRDAIKTAIMETGAVYAAYYSDDNSYLSNKNAYYCNLTDVLENHGILIIGWDDSYAKSNFITAPSGNGAWLCRNSWGDTWGDGGYFYMSYYDKTLTSVTSFRVEGKDNYSASYQYDRDAVSVVSFKSYDAAGANIFSAAQNDVLSAVSFYTSEAETGYTVRIYTGVSGSAPDKGKLVCEQTGSELYAGYHTIPLDQLVQLKKGERFSVVLMVDNGGIYLDSYAAKTGVSYYAAVVNGKPYSWTAAARTLDDGTRAACNVCIKAFTKEGVKLDETNFPDANFLKIAAGYDLNGDGILSSAETGTVKTMNVSGRKIASLEGIQYFTSLVSLDCSKNPLLFVNAEALTALETFKCDGCSAALGTLSCTDFQTLGLDLSRVDKLTGARKGTDGLLPDADTITYTYYCGAKSTLPRTFTITASATHRYGTPVSSSDTQHTSTCTDCGHTELSAHTFGSWTDQKDGTHQKVCTACGKAISAAHTYGAWTATADGKHKHVCTVCNAAEEAAHACTTWKDSGDGSTHSGTCSVCSTAVKEAHTYGKYETDDKGNHYRTCTKCGYVQKAAHTFGIYTKNADGTHTRECSVCHYKETSEHVFTFMSMNDTQHLKSCKLCGYSETLSHRWTYTENKYSAGHSMTCEDCGYSERVNHIFGSYTDNKDGTHTHACTLCGSTETGAHTYGSLTDNKDGTHSRTCTLCGSKETEKHSFGAWVADKSGTHSRKCACGCVEQATHEFGGYTINPDGTHTLSCTVCGYTETVAHTFGAYTDNKDGTHTRKCVECGFAESAAHIYGTKYTINKDGTHSLTCTKCSHVEKQAHTFGKASDNGNGTHSRICSTCRYVETKSHTFGEYKVVDGIPTHTCTECGAIGKLYGDADGDLKLGVADIILLQKRLLGLEAPIKDERAVDMNGDGRLDIFDLALLKRAVLRQKLP